MRFENTNTAKITSLEGKIQILKDWFFSLPQDTSLEDLNTAHYPAPWQSNIKVTPEEIKTAIQSSKSDKAPEINRISSRFLK